MNLINLFASHRLAASLTMIVMVLAGFLAIKSLNIGLNPTMDPDRVSVTVIWRGASAEDVEKLITTPLEQQLRSLPDVKTIRSTTRDTSAYVQVQVEQGADIQRSIDEIKQRISQIQSFPVEIEPPIVQLEEYKDLVATVLVTGSGDANELLPMVHDMEKELLSRGADIVQLQAVPKQEIAIQVSSQTLFDLGLSYTDLSRELSQLSQDAPGGTVGSGQMSRQLRSLDQRRDADEFNSLPIMTTAGGSLVRLGDIATIEKRGVIDQWYATVGGNPAIQMRVQMNSGSDAIASAELLHAWVDDTRQDLPEGVSLTLFVEAWTFIQDELNLIRDNGLTGLVLVILALLVFLQFRVAFWVMVGMPVTFLAALLGFYYFGGSLNAISLIAIVMALGIVVDDAIVVGEEAVTQFNSGKSPSEAATLGANRMFLPVMASSLTTLCAFFPLLMSDMGPIIEIPLMMLCVIGASLVECFLVLPGHLRGAFEKSQGKPQSRFHAWFNAHFDDFRENTFRRVVRGAMTNRRVVISGAFFLFLISLTMWTTGWIKTNMNLNINFEQINADIQFVAGANEEDKSRFLAHLEETLQAADDEFGGDNIVTFITNYNMARINNEQKAGSQYANLWLEMISPEQRDISADEFANAWLDRVESSYVVDSLTIKKQSNWWGDFSILLKGDDAAVLKEAASEVIAELSSLDGVTNIHDNLPYGKDQWIFQLTTEGRALGLTTAEVGRQLRAAYDGARIQIFQEAEREMEVRLMLPESERADLSSVGHFPIKTPDGQMIPLRNVASWEGKRGLDVIRHHNAQKTVEISGNIDIHKISGGEVVEYFDNNVKEALIAKYGITTGLDGASLEEQEASSNFLTRYLIALALIYIVLAWVFSSYTWPLAVMAVIPFGLTGALLGHFFMGMAIGPMSMLGLFTLTGIIINDSIILVSAYQNLVKEGVPRQRAIEDAVCARLRPVLLTSVTTVAGLFPLMLETAPMAAAFTPLATSICFGMLYGTILVLLVVPAVLSAIITINEWFERKGHAIYESHTQQTA